MAHHRGSGPVVGLTGARFGGRYVDVEAETLALPAVAEQPEAPAVELTGARFGGPSRRKRRAAAAAASAPAPAIAAPEIPALEPGRPPAAADHAASRTVRPYVLTRGRTRSDVDLAIETLVSAVPSAVPGNLVDGDIVDLCREPRSVAEIAALRGLPLGVARVLLGDLAAAGAVAVHRTADASGPDLDLMQRVLSGLRRL